MLLFDSARRCSRSPIQGAACCDLRPLHGWSRQSPPAEKFSIQQGKHHGKRRNRFFPATATRELSLNPVQRRPASPAATSHGQCHFDEAALGHGCCRRHHLRRPTTMKGPVSADMKKFMEASSKVWFPGLEGQARRRFHRVGRLLGRQASTLQQFMPFAANTRCCGHHRASCRASNPARQH